MSNSKLPQHPSLEYLRKLAKDRLQELRRTDPHAKLATVLLQIARDHGFSSWRALKAEIEQRQTTKAALLLEAGAKGDVDVLSGMLAKDPSLVRASDPAAHYQGWTALHTAAKGGHVEAVRLLLDHGADPNAREAGDNTYPLHWAAAGAHLETVRVLLDGGSEVHGIGDVHEADVIGWAVLPIGTRADTTPSDRRREVISLLLDRGARHHIFSAMSLGDLDLIRTVVEQNPEALDRRQSRFEHGKTPLHFVIPLQRYDILDLLIELGADLEAKDDNGLTPLEVAMLRGDGEAIRRLHAAGAKQPKTIDTSSFSASMAKLADSIKKGVPMIYVPEVARALDWYASIGFKEIARYADDGFVNFGIVSFGKAELMLNMHGKPGSHDVSLWFYTDQIEHLYQLLKSRQLTAAQAALAGEPRDQEGIEFEQDLEEMFYGVRQFGIRDLNGYVLYFEQPVEG